MVFNLRRNWYCANVYLNGVCVCRWVDMQTDIVRKVKPLGKARVRLSEEAHFCVHSLNSYYYTKSAFISMNLHYLNQGAYSV